MNTRPSAQEPGELPCAVGGSLTPGLLLDAVRAGWIVVPVDGAIWLRAAELRFGALVDGGTIAVHPSGSARAFGYTYWNPSERFVIPAGAARIHPRQRRRLRGVTWTSTIDRAMPDVVEQCRRDREPRWMSDEYVEVLTALWRDGRAYSSEIWADGELVAGGFGYAVGDVVTVESHFTRRANASKVSIVDVAVRAAEAGCSMIDLQWPTMHGAEVGGRPAPADHLVRAFTTGTDRKLAADERPVTSTALPGDR